MHFYFEKQKFKRKRKALENFLSEMNANNAEQTLRRHIDDAERTLRCH
jgi:hypothetical protein